MTPVYGARLTDHTPPNGTVYVRAGAPLDGAGTLAAPMGDSYRAIRNAPTGGTIALAGDFPVELAQLYRKPVTLQTWPGERARLIGDQPATLWERVGLTKWRHWGPILDHTPQTTDPTFLNPDRPYACWPEQLWCDQQRMRMVAPGTPNLGPDEFYVEAGGAHIIGIDPTDHEMRVAVRSTAFVGALDTLTGQHPPVALLGIEAWGYATTSMDRAAIKVHGPSTIVDVTVADCSAAGISMMRGAAGTIEHCTLLRNGQLGVHAYDAADLDLGWCWFDRNHTDGYAYIGAAGAAKWNQCVRANAHHNLLTDNDGHGLWADIESHDSQWWRNDVDGGRTGVFCENTLHGRIHGNRVTGCLIGILVSDSSQATVTHNTATGNGRDIVTQPGHRHPEWDGTDHVLYANVTSSGPDATAVPTYTAATLLELSTVEADTPHTGWYGPEYLPPTPPEESPMPYDLTPADAAVVTIGTVVIDLGNEIRRLEGIEASLTTSLAAVTADLAAVTAERDALQAIIDADNDDEIIAGLQAQVTALQTQLATITAQRDALAIQVWNLAVQVNQANATISTLNATIGTQNTTLTTLTTQVTNLTTQVDGLTAQLATVTAERDTAEAANEEAQELLGEANQTIAARDATITAMQTEIDDLTLALAECESQVPELDEVIVGGSHKNGWQALKTMTTPVTPMAYRKYIGAATISTGDMSTISGVITDGGIPFISPQRCSVATPPGPSSDTVTNVQALLAAGHDTAAGVYTIMHEPTQKGITAAEFQAMYDANAAYIRSNLPLWKVVPCFMRFDFDDPNATRFPGNGWLPTTAGVIDGIGIDVYDKHTTTGKSFAELMIDVETWVAANGDYTIYVMETSCPDTGQYQRPAGWKPDWIRDAWLHVRDTLKADGSRRYGSFLTFNSDVGPDSPPAVVGPPAVKAGWWWDTTPEAQAAYVEVIGFAENE
jgi:parallel beta-helix repeat protein